MCGLDGAGRFCVLRWPLPIFFGFGLMMLIAPRSLLKPFMRRAASQVFTEPLSA